MVCIRIYVFKESVSESGKKDFSRSEPESEFEQIRIYNTDGCKNNYVGRT
jgi:hypothetical protein